MGISGNMFKVRKAAQVAAYFAKAEGGSINVLKLVKLIYLADREFLERYDATILNDRFVSMNHGPVNSMTYDYIKGCEEDRDNWEEFINDRTGHRVGLARENITEDDLGELSDAELAVLADVWRRFGHMNGFEIREWTHDNCPEWEDPNGSSQSIPFARVLSHLGKSNVRELAAGIEAERTLDRLFAPD